MTSRTLTEAACAAASFTQYQSLRQIARSFGLPLVAALKAEKEEA